MGRQQRGAHEAPELKILFVCTHNSARSQMAEALARARARSSGIDVEVISAGTEIRGVHPLALRAMAQLGIDISQQRSKTLSDVPADPDYVITLCHEGAESCPMFPAKTQTLHWPLPDPSAASGSEEDRLSVFRSVREEISRRVDDFFRQNWSV